MQYSQFESELKVRPDDIDMNQHVHNSKYLDYVLAARYEQMNNNYKMPMEEFIRLGFGWVVQSVTINFKRPLLLGDTIIVRTRIEEMLENGVKVHFEIVRKESMKLASDGVFHYTMINIKTGRSELIPQFIIDRYTI